LGILRLVVAVVGDLLLLGGAVPVFCRVPGDCWVARALFDCLLVEDLLLMRCWCRALRYDFVDTVLHLMQ
jgi:hypothetical protein